MSYWESDHLGAKLFSAIGMSLQRRDVLGWFPLLPSRHAHQP